MWRFGCTALVAGGLLLGCASPSSERRPGDIAAAYTAAGRLDEAVREIELAVRVRPEDPELRRQAAEIYQRSGEPDRAAEHLEAAIAAAPANGPAWADLAELENERENLEDAYVAYRRAAQLAPDDIRAVSGLALTADSLGFDTEASEAYARWAELERRLRELGDTPAP